MNWLNLALSNCRRRPVRTLVTVAGVAIAVAALFSLLAFQRGYKNGMTRELDRLGAHILVVPKGCPYDAASIALHGANWPCYLKDEYLKQVREITGIAAAAPALMSAFYEDGRSVVYVGIDEAMLALKPGWRVMGKFPAHNEVLLGAETARKNNWRIGQEIVLPELDGPRATISGILAPTQGADDTFTFLPLADAQKLFGHGNELTHILVRLADTDNLDATVSALRGCDAGMEMNIVPMAHLFHTIQNLVDATRVLMGCVALVALLVAGSGVSNTILVAVAERVREIGVMRALGASRAQIFGIFWMETLWLCAAGSLAGIAGAFVASRGIESWLRERLPFAPTDPLIQWNGPLALACIFSAVLLGCVAGLLPAWRAARLSPVVAIRAQGGGA
jgi:putative ABC transport system permease protein